MPRPLCRRFWTSRPRLQHQTPNQRSLFVVAIKSGHVKPPRIAAEALGNIGANAKSAVPAVLDAMKTEDKEDWIIYAIALGKIASALMDAGDKDSLPSLTKVLTQDLRQ